jgi:hypothetical protein
MGFYAVIIREQAQPFLITASSAEELASFIKAYVSTETYAFPFFGAPMSITKGPRRNLIDTNNKLHPLFDDVADAADVDITGYLN